MKSFLFQAVRVFANSVDPFIPELWAQEGLAVLEENMVIGGLVHRDFENVIQSYGDVVNTRRPGTFTPNRKGVNDDVITQDVTSTNVAIPLNQHSEVTFMIRDVEQSYSFKDLVSIYLQEAVIGQARLIDQILLGQYNQFYANYLGGRSGITSSTAKDLILDVRNKMNRNKAYVGGRNMIWGPDSETAVLKDESFTSAEKVGDGGSALQNANIGYKLGFSHFMGQNAPSVGAVTGNSAGAINESGGYTIGTTTLVVDGFSGTAVVPNQFISIAGDCYRVVSASLTSTHTTGIVIASPGLRKAVVNDAVVIPVTKGTVNLSAGYAAGYAGKLTVSGPAIFFQAGQTVVFGTSTSASPYTVVQADSANNTILLDRPLDAALANSDNIHPSGAAEYNFAFHRNAIALVVRPLAPAPVGVRSAVISYNGLSMRATISYNPTKQGLQVTLDMLFGIKVLDVNLGCVLIG